jgi:DNA modification methylase
MKAHEAELSRLEAEHERKRNLGLLPDPFAGFPSDDDEEAEQEEDWDKTGAEVRRMQEQARQAQVNRERGAQQREQSRREDLERRAAGVTEIPTDIWDVRLGDCAPGLAGLDGVARLVFADPPYNIGWNYGDGIQSDLLSGHAFLTWCRDWLCQIPDVLTADGSFWLLISDEYAAEIKIAVEDTGLYLRQWLIWYESFGANCSSKFNRTHRHLLHFVKDESDFVFHELEPAIRRPSDRQVKYADPRASAEGKLWDSVWGINPPIPRVCGTHLEAIPGSPAPQLPLALLNPIIACASDPGDLVVDPFVGNATTGVAAINLGRRFIGFEKREPIHQLAMLRMKAAWSEHNQKRAV